MEFHPEQEGKNKMSHLAKLVIGIVSYYLLDIVYYYNGFDRMVLVGLSLILGFVGDVYDKEG